MYPKLLLCLLLLPISAAYAMENLSTKIITYNIATRFDRDDRTASRLINKKFSQSIVPQHILNEQYEAACKINDIPSMIELRRKGALHQEEETYILFLHKKPNLIIKIIPYNQHDIANILLYGIEQDNVDFIQWILGTYPPTSDSSLWKKWTHTSCNETLNPLNQLKITLLLSAYHRNLIATTLEKYQ